MLLVLISIIIKQLHVRDSINIAIYFQLLKLTRNTRQGVHGCVILNICSATRSRVF